MNVYVVCRKEEEPEAAFESMKLAGQYIADRVIESSDRGHFIVKLELVKDTDWVTEHNAAVIRGLEG